MQFLVDPLGAVVALLVLNALSAEVPCLDGVGNVQGLSDFLAVQVVDDGDTEGARRQVSQVLLINTLVSPGCVVSGGEGLLVGLQFVADFGDTDILGLVELEFVSVLGAIAVLVASTVHVVDVNVLGQVHKSEESSSALSGHVVGEVSVLVLALVVSDGVVEVSVVESVPVGHLDVGGGSVHVPVSAPVAHNVALQVEFERVGFGALAVVLINLIHNIRHIDAGVRLSGDVEVVALEFGEFGFIPVEEGSEVVCGGDVVVEVAFST